MLFFSKFELNFRGNRNLRNTLVLLADMAAAAAAHIFSYATVISFAGALNVPGLGFKTLAFAVVSGFFFVTMRQYRGSWRYVSVFDLMTIVRSCALAVVCFTVGTFLWTRGADFPRSVLVLSFIFLICILAGVRIGYRIVNERISLSSKLRQVDKRTVLLCGFTDKAESFIRSNRRNIKDSFDIAGILDDTKQNFGRYVQGVKVVGTLDDFDEVVLAVERSGRKILELIVTEEMPGRNRLEEILTKVSSKNIKVSRIPDHADTSKVTGESLSEPQPIEIGDLLERPEFGGKLDNVAQLIAGKAVLVTGAGGSIGSELCRQIIGFDPAHLVVTDNSEFHLYTLYTKLCDQRPDIKITMRIVDVREMARVRHVVADASPDVIFHAAALKHVPIVEENPLEAVKTNLLGTKNVADAALANKTATFVVISTDKAVNPTSIMGATKRASESYCQALDITSKHTRFKTVRFGNVLGSNGSVVPRFQEQIAAGGPVTVTHPDIVRYFMTIPEAVGLVLHASAHALGLKTERGKIMVLDMGKPMKISDLAERMIQLAGYIPHVDISIVYTGLRPGEKLYEELFDPSELLSERTEEGFFIASPRVLDRKMLTRTLEQIESHIDDHDPDRIIQLLLHLVPEYKKPLLEPPVGSSGNLGQILIN